MWLARMKRSSASGPPCSGSGAARRGSAIRSGVFVAVSSASNCSIAAQSYCPAMIAPAMADSTLDPTLAQRLLDGDRRALARAISLVENDRPEGWELVKEVYAHTGNA